MNKKSLNTLEYTKIIELLTQKAVSALGKARCRQLLPITDIAMLKKAQTETSQAIEMILKAGSLPLGGIVDIGPSLKRAEIGGVLNIEEIYNIGEFLYVCKKIINYSKSVEKREYMDILDSCFEQILILPKLSADINRSITNKQELADDASAALSSIRRDIKVNNARINDALNSIIHSAAYKNMLQDNIITIRSGRFCVPIKQEYKSSFPGMVHDTSSSGATLFIEPMSAVNLNNKIKELATLEKEEIERILLELTTYVAQNTLELKNNLDNLTYLDFIFAKGELALQQNATLPILNTDRYINIKTGRHPLLNVQNVVPTDIQLGSDFISLLITGPNTGGKTVALKVLGLFTLMGQAGLAIPAAATSEIAIFDNIFADIGDEQSIEQSLSTFSSHMTNIVDILNNIGHNDLVLFDELGAGTDPTEGAALAIAIIRYLMDRNVRTAVTTHYSELKLFAISTQNVENAAVEFDIQTLRPTYKLHLGALGKSNAFAISKRLGLFDDIIEGAKAILTSESIRFEDIITDLETSKKTAEIEQTKALNYRKEAEELAQKLQEQKHKMEQSREKLLANARAEARAIVVKAKDETDKIIKDMQKFAIDENLKQMEQKRQVLGSKITELSSGKAINEQKQEVYAINRELKIGDDVFIHSLAQNANVIEIFNSKKEVRVRFGAIEVKVKIKDLSFINTRGIKKNTDYTNFNEQNGHIKSNKSISISPKIDLRGLLVDEAIEKFEKYLDDAYLSNVSKIEIIHGKGTGALRNAVTQSLRNHPYIKSYRLGELGEGDSGVTIAELV